METNTLMVKIAFPKNSEIRIGSALRLVVSYYIKLNRICYEKISEKKLIDFLNELSYVYKYENLINYSAHILDSFIGMDINMNDVHFDGIDALNEKSDAFGEDLIPIEMFKYLNETVLNKLIAILLKNMKENKKLNTYIIVIERKEYEKLFNSEIKNELGIDVAIKFIEGLKNWLEYNMILRVPNFYVQPRTHNIVFPVKFSFLEKI